MRLLISFAALMLSGCWTGDGLYSDGDARPAVPSGIYQMSYAGETHTERVSLLPNGLTKFTDEDGTQLFGFVPLDAKGTRFVAWDRDSEAPPSDHTQGYLVLESRANGEFFLYMPNCIGNEAEIAKRAGATVRVSTVNECQFPTRASLETAMREVRISREAVRLVRTPGK